MQPCGLIRYGTYFNPRSPRGGATQDAEAAEAKVYISIHAPHEGERRLIGQIWQDAGIFQSTLPTRGSDRLPPCGTKEMERISIHAPHEGERPAPVRHTRQPLWIFQSTLPTRGSDLIKSLIIASPLYFNPRSPRGGATKLYIVPEPLRKFQSTLPTRGSDRSYFAL